MRRPAVIVMVVLVAALLGGYAYADVRDLVPGPLTTTPAPQEYPELVPAPGAVAPTEPPAPTGSPFALDPQAPVPTGQGLGAALGPGLADPALGPSVSAAVFDVQTGRELYSANPRLRVEPASVAKVLTAAAALQVLGADAVLPTSTVMVPGSDVVHLVGSGDLMLTEQDLTDLAGHTADRLRAGQISVVRLRLDDSRLAGLGWSDQVLGPGVTQADVSAGFVAPMTGLAINAGRTTDINYSPRVADPGLAAAQVFAEALGAHGITVTGQVTRERMPQGTHLLARHDSAPVSSIVGTMLDHSDNNVAEALARLVAVRTGGTAGFAAGGTAVLTQVHALGVNTASAVLSDGSGLSDGSALSAEMLADLIAVAGSDEHPQLRPLLEGLPVGGLTGTLSERFGPETGAQAGIGTVRAKTGTLSGVASLAGVVVTRDGRLLSYAIMADQVPSGAAPSRAALDRASVVLLECGCR